MCWTSDRRVDQPIKTLTQASSGDPYSPLARSLLPIIKGYAWAQKQNGYAQGSRLLKIELGILEMHEVPEPCLLSHDLVGVSGNLTWKIGLKQGDTASPGRRAGWKILMRAFRRTSDGGSLRRAISFTGEVASSGKYP